MSLALVCCSDLLGRVSRQPNILVNGGLHSSELFCQCCLCHRLPEAAGLGNWSMGLEVLADPAGDSGAGRLCAGHVVDIRTAQDPGPRVPRSIGRPHCCAAGVYCLGIHSSYSYLGAKHKSLDPKTGLVSSAVRLSLDV